MTGWRSAPWGSLPRVTRSSRSAHPVHNSRAARERIMGDYFFLIVAVPVIGFLGLLMWAAQRGRPVEGPGGTLVFRHGLLLRGFALFAAFGIPLGITVLVFFNPPKTEGDLTAIICLYA